MRKAYPISSGGLGRSIAQLQRRLSPQRHCFFVQDNQNCKARAEEPVKTQRSSRLWGRGGLSREKCENGDWLTSGEKAPGGTYCILLLHHRSAFNNANSELSIARVRQSDSRSCVSPSSAEALLVIMSSSREGVNPLRPYYVPPQIGLSPGPATSNASAPPNAPSASTKAFGSSARDLLSDLDYSDYLESSPSVSDWVREALDRAVWRYTSVLMAQPFDVAKTILQVYVVPDAQDGQAPPDERRRQSQGYREQYFEEVRWRIYPAARCYRSGMLIFFLRRIPSHPTMRAVTLHLLLQGALHLLHHGLEALDTGSRIEVVIYLPQASPPDMHW